MDVVYLVREGDRNEELRYSFRSLRHLSHDRVWVAGYCPAWVSDAVGRIPVKQSPRTKYRNGTRNLRAALAHPEVSDPFVLMNDDFFVLHELAEIPVLHRGPMSNVLRSQLARRARRKRRGPPRPIGGYSGNLLATYDLLVAAGIPDPIAYEPIHVPIPIAKGPMLEVLDLIDQHADRPGLHYRTLYGNLHAIAGEQGRNVKISGNASSPRPDQLFVSTNDKSWERGRVGKAVRDRFPDPSPYERTAP